ncbi:MAG: thiamine phosphate synthase [Myxococcota bacterium]
MRNLNISLQLVLEPHSNLPWLISEAVRGGVTCVQWRDKFFSDHDFYEQAKVIKQVCSDLSVPLIINDRLDMALAIGAEAVHLGQKDMPFHVARRILPDHVAIGISAESLEDVEKAADLDLDYLAISPVFKTATKTDLAPPFGFDGLEKARKMSRHRLVAIGGIKAHHVSTLRQIGVDGVAVVSAIMRAQSPYEAAKAFVL